MGLVTLREPEVSLGRFKASKSAGCLPHKEGGMWDRPSQWGAEVRDTQGAFTQKLGGQRRREGSWQPGSLDPHGSRMLGQTHREAPGFRSPGSQRLARAPTLLPAPADPKCTPAGQLITTESSHRVAHVLDPRHLPGCLKPISLPPFTPSTLNSLGLVTEASEVSQHTGTGPWAIPRGNVAGGDDLLFLLGTLTLNLLK